jgi:hypothetical protein
MATEKQIAANRRNAQKSTGPKTPEGKARCAQNATKHGAYSDRLSTAEASNPRFRRLLKLLRAEFRPRDAAETALVESMAAARWNVLHLWFGKPSDLVGQTGGDTIRSLDCLLRSEARLERQFSAGRDELVRRRGL